MHYYYNMQNCNCQGRFADLLQNEKPNTKKQTARQLPQVCFCCQNTIRPFDYESGGV